MVEDEKLTADEARRAADHAAVKGAVRSGVQAQIARKAGPLAADDQEQAEALAGHFRDRAVAEVAETEAEIGRGRVVARISQVFDFIFFLIYAVIGLMIVLDLIGANRGAGFYQFVNRVSSPLLAPFRGLVDDPSAEHMRFRLSYLVALLAYVLLHVAINNLLRLVAHRKTRV